MDSDFVNTYIEKLNAALHDLTSKNVVLETRLAHTDKVNKDLVAQVESLTSQLERAKKKTTSSE